MEGYIWDGSKDKGSQIRQSALNNNISFETLKPEALTHCTE